MNEKVLNFLITVCKCIIAFLCGLIVGYYFYPRQSGDLYKRFEQLERTAKEQQSEFAETVGSLESEVRNLRANRNEAKRIVDSMGVQLDDSGSNIKRAAELLKTLRTQIMDLQNLYSSGYNRDELTNMEVK